MLTARTEGDRDEARSAADAHLGAQGIQPILDLLARHRRRAPVEHFGDHIGDLGLPDQRLLVAEAQHQIRLDSTTACALGQQRHLDAAHLEALGALVDVGRRRLEHLDRRRRRLSLETLELRGDIDLRRDRRAQGLVSGNVQPERAGRRQQGLLGHPLHIGERCIAHPIPRQEEHAPVALRDAFAQRHADGLGVGERLVPTLEPLRLCAVEFFLRDGASRLGFERIEQGPARRRRVLRRAELGTEQQETRLGQSLGETKGRCSETLLGQTLVQPTCRCVAEQQREQFDRGEIGMRARRYVVRRVHHRHAAVSTQGDAALAVLNRIERVERGQDSRGLLDRTERLRDPLQRLRGIELAGHDQRGVVGLVVLAIERLQTRDVDVLDVRARADGVLAVVVPLVHRGQRLREQDAVGAVLAHLHLVAHHRHFGVEVTTSDEAVGHRIGLPAEVPAQVVVVGREARGVVGAVEPGAAVGGQPALGELAPDLRMFRRSLEEQVLEQVRHAGLAVVLVTRAHSVGEVDGGRRLRIVRYQQHLQPVRQAVLVDAFDGLHPCHAAGKGLR